MQIGAQENRKEHHGSTRGSSWNGFVGDAGGGK